MPTYRVLVSGVNLLLDVDGEQGRYGFEVARFVEARDAADAEEQALTLIRESRQIRLGARNAPSAPPVFRVVEVRELGAGERMPPNQPGFAFYPDELDA